MPQLLTLHGIERCEYLMIQGCMLRVLLTQPSATTDIAQPLPSSQYPLLYFQSLETACLKTIIEFDSHVIFFSVYNTAFSSHRINTACKLPVYIPIMKQGACFHMYSILC